MEVFRGEADVFADRAMTTLSFRTGLSNVAELLPLSEAKRLYVCGLHQKMNGFSRQLGSFSQPNLHGHLEDLFVLRRLKEVEVLIRLECAKHCGLRPQHPFIRNRNSACSSSCDCSRCESQ